MRRSAEWKIRRERSDVEGLHFIVVGEHESPTVLVGMDTVGRADTFVGTSVEKHDEAFVAEPPAALGITGLWDVVRKDEVEATAPVMAFPSWAYALVGAGTEE